MNESIHYLLKAKQIWDITSPDHANAIGNTGNLGAAFYSAALDSNFISLQATAEIPKNKVLLLQKAEALLEETTDKCRAMGFDRDLHYFTGELAKVEEAKGDFKTANTYWREYISLGDSIYSQENKNKIAAIEGEREVALRDKELLLNKATISAQNRLRAGLVVGLLLALIIGILLYHQNRIRKKTNNRLVALNDELDEANKLKAKFFAILSHDFRQPVANLVSLADIREQSPESLTNEELLIHQARISETSRQLLQQMEQILLWSKGQMEKFKPDFQPVKISNLFLSINNLFPADKSKMLSFKNPHNLHVFTDANYLQIIMQNLTANAAQQLKNKTNATIEWTATEDDKFISLSISDNGPGMPADKAAALFSNSDAMNARTGFGFYIIKDLAKAIDCTIMLGNETPGTKISLLLKN